MRQALHIFKKDVRFLRGEIALVLILTALLLLGNNELLVILAGNYAIARLIHAEAIPGHNQFWITRPYRWKSLLGAKVLFILIFVNLPFFVAQCCMIVMQSFSFAESLPGLLWSQILMIFCLSLPVAALASLTSGMIPFLLSEFIVVAAVGVSQGLLGVRRQWVSFLPALQAGPAAIDWVRDSLVGAIIVCLSAFILHSQYKTRRTEQGNRWAIGGGMAAGVVFLLMPWSLALAVQSELSKQAFDGSSLKVVLDSVAASVFPLPGKTPIVERQVSLPVAVSGVPDGLEMEDDALRITLEGADGETWSSGFVLPNLIEAASGHGKTVIDGLLRVDPAFFDRESAHPVTVHAKLYVTLFGNPRSVTIPIQNPPVNAIDGLQCFAGLFNQLHCKSIFRWPMRRVYARTGEGGVESYVRSVSYSPYPATLGFNPIEEHSFSGGTTATKATITTLEPLSHFEVEREIRGVSLMDYTPEAKRRFLAPPPPGVLR